jgi:hypothetical protein
MTALAKDTQIKTKSPGLYPMNEYPVKAASQIWAGSIVGIDATGFAIAHTGAANVVTVGIADEAVLGGATDGAKWVRVKEGIFKVANNGTVLQAHVGRTVDVVDDNTVKIRAAGQIGGCVTRLDSDGVWLEITLAKVAP